MLSVFLVLMIFVVCEEAYIKKTTNEMTEALQITNIKSKEDLNSVLDKWKKNEKKLQFFINHKELQKITIELHTMQCFYNDGNTVMYHAFLARSREAVRNMPNY